MHDFQKIENILIEEILLYKKIYNLEKDKQDAILKRDGRHIDRLCMEQEEILAELSEYENGRVREINSIRLLNNTEAKNSEISLKDISSLLDKDAAAMLMKTGKELKDLVLKISRLQATNKALLQDNLEYVNTIISGIKYNSTMKAGYGRNGKEDGKVASSLLFNQTA